MVKKFKVLIEVREIATKTTTIDVEASTQGKAKGIAEYRLEQNPDKFPYSNHHKEITILKSGIIN